MSDSDISFEEEKEEYNTYPRTEKLTCRFGKKITWAGGIFNKKSIVIVEGKPLPATFSFGKGQFSLVVGKDLSVTFNGTKLEDSLVERTPEELVFSPSLATSTPVITRTSSDLPSSPGSRQNNSALDILNDSDNNGSQINVSDFNTTDLIHLDSLDSVSVVNVLLLNGDNDHEMLPYIQPNPDPLGKLLSCNICDFSFELSTFK